jgi:hypothetical protein
MCCSEVATFFCHWLAARVVVGLLLLVLVLQLLLLVWSAPVADPPEE